MSNACFQRKDGRRLRSEPAVRTQGGVPPSNMAQTEHALTGAVGRTGWTGLQTHLIPRLPTPETGGKLRILPEHLLTAVRHRDAADMDLFAGKIAEKVGEYWFWRFPF